jgi:hypothetical protein
MLENSPNSPQSDKTPTVKPLTNPLADYTPKFVNGASLPGGMRWNDLGLDHVPLQPKEEDNTLAAKPETPPAKNPDSI